jgi:nucleoid-associated protein YgaU
MRTDDHERERTTVDRKVTARGASAAAVTGALALLVVAPPAGAGEVSQVRFLHAVPGAGPADLLLAHAGAIAREGFGGLSGYHAVPAGLATLELAAKPGADALATHATRLTAGRRYTIYAVAQGGQVTLNVLRDAARGTPAARLRVVHAAPELGKPDLWWAGRKLAGAVPYMATTGYVDAGAGAKTLAVAAPGRSADPIASRTVQLTPGEAMTAFVIGSKGRRVHIVTGHDARVAASKGTYVVREGDNLWSIAARRLGGGATPQQIEAGLRVIWAANAADIPSRDPDLILPGQRLRMR